MLRNHLVWNDQRHGIGIAAIDGEHRHMIELINRINDLLCDKNQTEAAWKTLDELLHVTQEHFVHEEQLMARNGYPAMPDHVEEHHKLLEQIRNLIGEGRPPSQVRAGLVTAFLADWAELHILEDDSKLGQFLAAREAGGRTAAMNGTSARA